MAKPLDLAGARILVTNDDGVHAPGIKVLERIAKSLSKDVWVVAPESEQSATSHSLTLRRPLRVQRLGPRRFSVDGTPTDCVLLAHKKVVPGIDLVLSGINHGGNLGEDVTYSGTVAAAMEAAVLGLPAIAFSQVRRSVETIRWTTAERFGPRVIERLATLTWSQDLLINVNFPAVEPEAVEGIRICRQGRRQAGIELVEGADPKGRPYLWIGDFIHDRPVARDTDLAAVEEGAIAVTPLHLDLTHRRSFKSLTEAFA
jgi:5'-nucleotidase